MERWRNDTDKTKSTYRRKICPTATLSTTNPTWAGPRSNQVLREKRPLTNGLSHGTDWGAVVQFQMAEG